MANTEHRIEFLQQIASLLSYAKSKGYDIICAAFHRTPEEQNALYKKGLSRCDGYIILSSHQLWLAMDLYLIKDGVLVLDRCPEYEDMGKYWRELGGRWEPIPGDIYHFEHVRG